MSMRALTDLNQLPGTPLRGRMQALVAAGFFLAALVTRLPVFFRSVLDHDESLYFLMAGAWRAGHLPYTTIWDNKPLGIYAIFALFQLVLGGQVWVMRLASVCAVSLAAFAVFKIVLRIPAADGKLLGGSALFAGIIYLAGSLSNDGLAANTEIFMCGFTAFAVLTALSPEWFRGWPVIRGLVCGLLFGMAVMTKYVAVFEAPAIGFAMLCVNFERRNFWRLGVAAAAGAALPLVFVILIYAAAGQLPVWWEASVLSNFRRVATPVPAGALEYAFNLQCARWLPLYLAAAILVVMTPWLLRGVWVHRRLRVQAGFQVFLLLWLAGGSMGVAAAKSFYDHYFLQILPVLCVILAWVMLRFAGNSARRFLAPLLLASLTVPAVAGWQALTQAVPPSLTWQNGWIGVQPDTPERIAEDVAQLPPGAKRRIYVFDYQPIIYSLTGQTPPTRYVFPSVLTTCFLAHVARVQAAMEVARILATQPDFIIRSRYPATDPAIINQAVYTMMDQALAARYEVWRRYHEAVVYRLRDDSDTNPLALPPEAETCLKHG